MDIEHVNQLLAYRGATFVKLAYRAVLGRDPDLQGQSHFVQRAERLHDKVAIICELAMSSEGRTRPAQLRGLDFLVQLHEPRQGRVRRWLQRMAQGVATSERIEVALDQLGAQTDESQRATEARLHGLDAQMAQHAALLQAQVHESQRTHEQLAEMAGELAQCARGLAELPQQLGALQNALQTHVSSELETRFAAQAAARAAADKAAHEAARAAAGEPEAARPSVLNLHLSAADGAARFLDDFAQALAASEEAQRLSSQPAA